MRWIGRELDAEEGGEAVRRSRSNGMPKKDGRGMLEMPAGPSVKFAQLMRISRTISPKAMVTMAR